MKSYSNPKRLFFLACVLAAFVLGTNGWSATAPGGAVWQPASSAMVTDDVDDAVMVQAAAIDSTSQQLVYRFPSINLARAADGTFNVTLPSTGRSHQPGEPMLPLLSTRVALPQGHELVSVSVTASDPEEVVLDAPVRHAQRPYPLSRPEDRVETEPSAAIYEADTPYPTTLQSKESVQTKRGVEFVDLVLYPVSYRPASGRLTSYGTLTLDVVTRPVKVSGLKVQASDPTWTARVRSEDDLLTLLPLMDNPQTLDAYQPEPANEGDSDVVQMAAPADPGQPTLPCRLSDIFNHVIITTRNIRDGIVEAGTAIAKKYKEHGYLMIVPDAGTEWVLDTQKVADAGGYPLSIDDAAEQDFVDGMMDNLDITVDDYFFAYEFDDLTYDGDTNGVPDWAEILDGTEVGRTFRFTYVAFTNHPLDDIVALRQAQGLSSTVVSIESIVSVYAASSIDQDDPNPEAMRAFIRDAYDKWITEYVVIVGDGKVMPMRTLQAYGEPYFDNLPSDLYFQCLDGSFNSDKDFAWGEPTDGADRMDGRPGEDIDLYAELAVGRVSISDALGMSNWVAKVVQYETDRLAGTKDYLGGALMVGEYLGFGGVSDYAKPMLEEIRLGSSENGYRTEGFAALDIHTNLVTLYDEDQTWTKYTAASYINSDQFSVLNHVGHCDEDLLMRLEIADVGLLTNSLPGFLYTQGCWPGAFDMEQHIAGELLGSANGVFGGVFNSRYGWGAEDSTDGPSQRYNRWFWHTFFDELIPVSGILNQMSHERNASRINEDYMRWCYYESNLLGDPAQWLYGIEPEVTLDREAYRSDVDAIVEVLLPLAGPGIQNINVSVTTYNPAPPGGMIATTNIVCTRFGPSELTALFRSDPISLASLGAVDGGTVVAQATLNIGTASMMRSDQADITDVPPQIVTYTLRPDETFVDFSFTTDRPVTSEARIGSTIPLIPDWQTVSATRATNHTIRLYGLTPFTEYFVGARIEDAAGNIVAIPSNLFSEVEGEYYRTATIGRETTLRTDWEQDMSGWTRTNINGGVCWEYGQPLTYGPQDDARCWGTTLNGRYPDGANAVLTSPPFGVRERPLLIIRQWVDIQYSPLQQDVAPSPPPFGDYGQIEVLSSGVWYNVNAYIETNEVDTVLSVGLNTYITGKSQGWETLRVNLPDSFGNQPLSVRFRFLSDQQSFGVGNPAGWYLDWVHIEDVPGNGLGISEVSIHDDDGFNGMTLVGDEDGLPEAGEIVALQPHLFNYGTNTFGNLTGELNVQIAGYPATNALLLDGAPASISYMGPIMPGDLVSANEWIRLQLAPNLAPGTVVTLLQSVTNATGTRFDSRYDLEINPVVPISGIVLDAVTSNAVNAVTVTIAHDDQYRNFVTGVDGMFIFNGLTAGETYALTADKPGIYSEQTQNVIAPASNVVFMMGVPIASYGPTSLEYEMPMGGTGTDVVIISNAVSATAPLHITLAEIDYHPAASGWLAVTPTSNVLQPGEDSAFTVAVDGSGLSAGRYTADLVFMTDDPALEEIRIPVDVVIWREPELSYNGILFEDDYHASADGDGILEAGETARIWIYLNNSSGFSDAVDITGTLSSANTNIVINPPPTLHWQYIAPYSSRLSTNGVEVVLSPLTPDNEQIDFDLELVYFDGAVWQTNQAPFSINIVPYYSVTGMVESLIWSNEASVVTATNVVVGATVTAEDINGNLYSSLPSDTNGVYKMPLLPSDNYWFKVYQPEGSSYVPPAGTNIFVSTDLAQNFLFNDYGSNGPIVRLDDVYVYETWPSDYDGAFEAGETLRIYVEVFNEGLADGTNVTDFLRLADMGALGPYMTVTDPTTGVTNTIPTVPAWALQYGYAYLYSETLYSFEVTINADAPVGAKQHFWLDTTDGRRLWPFDFSITVSAAYEIRGKVTYQTSGLGASDITVLAEFPDGTVLTDLTDYAGNYDFDGLASGMTNIVIRPIAPGNYSADPYERTLTVLTNDVSGLDFVLKPSELDLSPSTLSVTINEGQTTNRVLTISNTSTNAATVDLSVVYNRGLDDLLSAPEADPLSLILADTSLSWNELNPDDYVSGELEIRFADGTGIMERDAILKRYGLRATIHFKLIPACLAVPLDPATLGDGRPAALAPLAQTLQSSKDILYVQPAAKMTSSAIPNDPLFDKLYGLNNIRQTGGTFGADVNVTSIWDRTTGSEEIIVAVCDTGFDKTHPDLLPNLWKNSKELPYDANYDGYPGVQGVDDDGDMTNQLYHYDTVTDTILGPETVDPLFDENMWKDNQTRTTVPGSPGVKQWVSGANGVPDFFEMYVNGELPYSDLPVNYPAYFGDTDGDGVPNAFEDGDGDDIPDIFGDEDGDGFINETGIDFRDEDVMQGMYSGSTRLITQKTAILPWTNSTSYRIVVEQWNGTYYADYDDDENGYADDLNGWNFYHWDSDVTDGDVLSSHGTHVAGTIGAVGSNGVGVAGVNWNVKIMPLALTYRASSPYSGSPFTTSARIAKAIEYAITHGARVSNHSWGGAAASGVLYEIMELAERDYNHLFVIAAGNSANDVDSRKFYPAYFSTVLNNVITVAASDDHDQLASFSNYGQNSVQLAAPGVDIYSTWSSRSANILSLYEPAYLNEMLDSGELILEDGAYYRRMSGTSMAAPHVTGAAALLWSLTPDADYGIIKRALLDGVRLEPNLDDWVKTDGLLDIGRSVAVMGTDWLTFSTNHIAIAAGNSAQVDVLFNTSLNSSPGVFHAEIHAESEVGPDQTAVTMTVLGGGALKIADLHVLSDTDSDGFAEPGETVSFAIDVRNPGNYTYINLSGTLAAVTAGVGITTPSADWDYLYGGQVGQSLTAFTVTIPVGAPAETLFDLTLTADGFNPQVLSVALPTATRSAIDGRVVNTGGTGIEGAIVEYRGAKGGYVLSGANGAYRLAGLTDGDYMIRAIPSGYSRSSDESVTVAGVDQANVDLIVSMPTVSLSQASVHAGLVNEMMSTNTITIQNASTDSFAYTVDVMPQRRIGLFSDGNSLGDLIAPLERMGFDVDYYTNNYKTIHVVDVGTAAEEIVQDVRYTDDDATVFSYDMVIADLTGPHASGRVFSDLEADVFSRYLDLGGTVLFTGANPLNRPDNSAIAAMCGVGLGYVSTNKVTQAQSVTNWNGNYVTLMAGDQLSVSNWVYDLAAPTNAATEVLFTAGTASKVTRLSGIGARGTGQAMLWGGNTSGYDWRREGIWLDVLRDILHERFIQPMASQTSVSWLTATPTIDTVTSGSVLLDVTLSSGYLASDTYQAVILLRGLDTDEEVLPIPVSLSVADYRIRAYTSTGVMDAQGNPLQGRGNDEAPLYQVIYAGTNGVADVPNTTTGAPGGDDRLLAIMPSGQPFGRIGGGEGVVPDSGRFNAYFINTVSTNRLNPMVYVRAWDAATFASSLTFGDSVVTNLDFSVDFKVDFGSWSLNQSISTILDSNGDSLPDAWLRQHRPGLDPLAARTALATSIDASVIATLVTQSPSDNPPQPYRVRFSRDKAYMFVLDKVNNRLISIPTNAPSTRIFYGGGGTGNGLFSQPEGLAVDPRVGQYRIAVADTGNNRVQLFTYNPTTGVITFERTVGSLGSGIGKFNRPSAVAFDNTGRVFVADTSNHRVAIFRASDGVWFGSFSGNGDYVLNSPRGVAYDTDVTDGGVWVCDTGNHRLSLYFDNGVHRRSFGIQGSIAGRFQTPTDIRPWKVGTRRRLVVADKVNNRLQIFNTDGTHLASVGTGGGQVGQLSLPHGVEPLNDSSKLYIADTGNARIQRFSVTFDADADGLDDVWEDLNGLNSQLDDALADLDGDGISNLGEARIGTDANNVDSNGDGTRDGEAIQANLDPLVLRPLRIATLSAGMGGGSVFEWVSVAGATYQIETNASLLNGVWGVFTNVFGTTTGTNSLNLQSFVDETLFFQIKRVD